MGGVGVCDADAGGCELTLGPTPRNAQSTQVGGGPGGREPKARAGDLELGRPFGPKLIALRYCELRKRAETAGISSDDRLRVFQFQSTACSRSQVFDQKRRVVRD
jgi:hypothetical protein